MKTLKGLAVALALGLLSGCTTPCAPGALCSPQEPNTSAAAGLHAPGPGMIDFKAERGGAALVPDDAHPIRVALLLPLQSEKFGLPAEAVRDGFMAAYQRDRKGFIVNIVATGDAPQDTVAAYKRAAAANDLVVGPLPRPAVEAVAASGAVTRPTLALNYVLAGVTLPPQMLAMGLSIEDEARQAADWAAKEHPDGYAIVLAGSAPWQQRVAQAFDQRWAELGRTSARTELPGPNGEGARAAVAAMRGQIQTNAPGIIFAALDADQLRKVRGYLGTALPCYAVSPANPGREPGITYPELEGLRLVDVPWEVQRDHPAVMVYPRLAGTHTLEMDRLYALGIDAFRLAREMALRPGAPVELDGVTGKLKAVPGGASPRFERREAATVYRNGAFEPANAAR